ncbi:leucyl aminopeptidase family protein [bacterium SCSIO 12741]|nr:leucyl aminopeptidase family protein [bacterium SCSIO 12741]
MSNLFHKTGTDNYPNQIILCESVDAIPDGVLSDAEKSFVADQLGEKKSTVHLNRLTGQVFVYQVSADSRAYMNKEKARIAAAQVCNSLNGLGVEEVAIYGSVDAYLRLAFAEGVGMTNYQFLKYFSDQDKRKNSLKSIAIDGVEDNDIVELNAVVWANGLARTFVNEPLSYLTAEQYAHDIMDLGDDLGFKVEVFNKAKIQSMKMGGLLAVNMGSPNPPTFSTMEWKPENAVNAEPYILVGKGVVYDTGGLSLKPTPNSMDYMKSDMGGSAAVVGTICALTKAKLPIWVIGLVPATENRPDGNAYAPGDVIHMHNGMTVEVLNTDAEGRMILADALSYARKFNPKLVIDLATLTGAAARAIGDQAMISMGNADQTYQDELIQSGYETYERVVQFPFWDEYADQMKSHIADIKNIGGPEAGMITAGKFLEYFTKDDDGNSAYPYIHLDIAGPAYNHTNKNYRGIEGTGVGVRMLFDFFKRTVEKG